MAKKGNTEITSTISIDMPADRPVNALLLKTGFWKQHFPDEQNKLMIAQALNYCTYHKGLQILGYLITSSNLYLVLRIEKADISNMLAIFYDALRKEIKQHQEYLKNQKPQGDGIRTKAGEAFTGLFTQYDLLNHKLIQVITGQPTNEFFHDPQLAWLKRCLQHYNFCSIKDYSGAKGPVKITRL
jgi:hypothetical protein